MQIGSPDGGCRPVIAGNLFQQNKAKITVRRSICSLLMVNHRAMAVTRTALLHSA
jgi:hypothetical protein